MPAALTAADLADADDVGARLLGRQCHTGVLIASLPAPTQAAVILALTTADVATVAITAVLQNHGLTARAENVGRHRRRLNGGQNACKCPRLSEALS